MSVGYTETTVHASISYAYRVNYRFCVSAVALLVLFLMIFTLLAPIAAADNHLPPPINPTTTPQAPSAAFSCCLFPAPDYAGSGVTNAACIDPDRNIFSLDDQEACTALGGIVRTGELCSPQIGYESAAIYPGCQLGCCCNFGQDGSSFGGATATTKDQCNLDAVAAGGFFTLTFKEAPFGFTSNQCQTICNADLGGGPGQNNLTCAELGGTYGVAPPDGCTIFADASDQNENPGQFCFDAACLTEDNACNLAGGLILATGETCATDFIDGIDSCCAPTDIEFYACSDPQIGGTVCTQDQQCVNDLMYLLSSEAKYNLSINVPGGRCCGSCIDGGDVCETILPNMGPDSPEYLCRNFQDDNCNGQVDGQDTAWCSNRFTGRVIEDGTFSGVPNVVLQFQAQVNELLPPENYIVMTNNEGYFTVTAAASGTYDVIIQPGQPQVIESWTGSFSLNPGNPVVNDIEIRVASAPRRNVSGIVELFDGFARSPLQGAQVFINQQPTKSGFTPADGSYSLYPVIATRDLKAYAYHPTYGLSSPKILPKSQLDNNDMVGVDFVIAQATCSGVTPSADIDVRTPRPIGNANIPLFWEFDVCDVKRINVYRCEKTASVSCTEALSSTTIHQKIFSTTVLQNRSFEDTATSVETNYTYTLEVEYYEGNTVNTVTDTVSLYSGDQGCMDRVTNTEFCVKEYEADGVSLKIDAAYWCDINNTMWLVDEARGVPPQDCRASLDITRTCVERVQQNNVVTARCEAITDSCRYPADAGWPFNTFSNQEICSQLQGCYYDLTDTAVNACVGCDGATACTSYQSQGACLENACGIGLNSGECEWVAFDNQLGIGACRSAQVTSCEACGGNNDVLGQCPDKETCQGFGLGSGPQDSCYFLEDTLSCKSCATVSCYDYTTKQECTGGNDNPSFSFATWRYETSDECGINACRWSESLGCVRDADNSAIDPQTGTFFTNDPNKGDDCQDSEFGYLSSPRYLGASKQTCMSDVHPPESFAIGPEYHDMSETTTIFFDYRDQDYGFPVDDSHVEFANIWLCIEPENPNANELCDRRNRFTKVERVAGTFSLDITGTIVKYGTNPDQQFALKNGTNKIIYVPEDVHNNFGQVRTKELILDNIPPVISNVEAVWSASDTDFSLADIIVTADTDEVARCSINLIEQDGCFGGCKIPGIRGTSHFQQIFGVLDGTHQARVECTDDYNNTASVVESVYVDYDLTAFDPSPSGVIDMAENVVISIKSGDPLDCAFAPELLNYQDMLANFPASKLDRTPNGANEYVHSKVISPGSPDAKYTFYFACNSLPFESRDVTTFSVDTQEPQIKAFDQNGNEITQFDRTVRLVDSTVKFVCDDSNENANIDTFGCQEINYCFGTAPYTIMDCALDQKVSGSELDIDVTQGAFICVQANENEQNGMGGRASEKVCLAADVDQSPPRVFLDEQQLFSSTGSVTFKGEVLDLSYSSNIAASSNRVDVTAAPTIVGAQATKYRMFATWQQSITGATNAPKVTFDFMYANPGSKYTIELDASQRNIDNQPKLRIFRVTGSGTEEYFNDFVNWNDGGEDLSIQRKDANIILKFVGQTWTLPYVPTGSQFRFYSNTASSPTLSGFSIYDYDQPQNNRIEYKKSLTAGTFDAGSFKEDATPEFTIVTDVLSTGNLAVTYFLFEGIDEPGLISEPVYASVVVDTERPSIDDVTIDPAVFIDDENRYGIEHETDTTFSVAVTDNGVLGDPASIESVTIDVEDLPDSYQATYNQGTQTWDVNIPTGQFFRLGLYDFTVNAVDSVGNTNAPFTDTFRIQDTTGPQITLLFDEPYRTNNPRPYFEVEADEAINNCIIEYADANNVGRQQTFTQVTDTRYEVTLQNNILCEDGLERITEFDLTCYDTQNNPSTGYKFEAICDQEAPVVGFWIPNQHAQLVDYDRSFKEYLALSDASSTAPNTLDIEYVADEAVICRGTPNAALTFGDIIPGQNGGFELSNTYESSLVFDQRLDLGFREEIFEYTFKCIDIVGNPSPDRSMKIVADNKLDPQIFNFGPATSTSKITNIQLQAQRDVDCSYDVQGTDISGTLVPQTVSTEQHTRTYSSFVEFPDDGTYYLDYTCTLFSNPSAQTIVTDIPLYINSQDVTLAVSSPNIDETVISDEPIVTFTGSSQNAAFIVVASDATGQILSRVATDTDGSFTVPIAIPNNVLRVQIWAESDAGLQTVPEFVRLEYSGNSYIAEIAGLQSYAVLSDVTNMSLGYYSVGSDLNGATATLHAIGPSYPGNEFKIDEVVLDGSRDQALDMSSLLSVASTTESGSVPLVLRIEKGGELLTARNSIITVDPLAPTAKSVRPQLTLSPRQDFLGQVVYQNAIKETNLFVGGAQRPTTIDKQRVESSANLATDLFTFTATNDILHTASLNVSLVVDETIPQLVDFYVKSTGEPLSYTRQPTIVFEFNEPVKVNRIFQNHNDRNLQVSTTGFRTTHEATIVSDIVGDSQLIDVWVEDNIGVRAELTALILYEKGELQIQLLEPEFNVSEQREFTFTIGTNRKAECRYATTTQSSWGALSPFTETGQLEHSATVTHPSANPSTFQTFTVMCLDLEDENVPEDSATYMKLAWDPTPPQIDGVTFPNAIPGQNIIAEFTENILARVSVVSNGANDDADDVVCDYKLAENVDYQQDVPTDQRTHANPYDTQLGTQSPGDYNLYVKCYNRAGLSDEYGPVAFTIDYGYSAPVQFTQPAGAFINKTTTPLEVTVVGPTTGCSYSLNDNTAYSPMTLTQESGARVFLQDQITLAEGENEIRARCFETNEGTVDAQKSIIVDTRAPEVLNVSMDDKTQDLDEINFRVEATDDIDDIEGSGVDGYEYYITEGRQASSGSADLVKNITISTKNAIRATNLDLTAGQDYYVYVAAIDKMGFKSDYYESDPITAATSAEAQCNDGVKNGLETGVDCGGPDCDDCGTGDGCTTDSDCRTGQCTAGQCRGNDACYNGELDDGETDIDCGGECAACEDNKACEENSDCRSRYCTLGGVCEQSSCEDSIQNGLESDIDCGGPASGCNVCVDGNACIRNEDCDSNICIGKVCEAATCDDGFRNGLETDVDCGGPLCDACNLGSSCTLDDDCSVGSCQSGRCSDEADRDADSDGDGMPDWWEDANGLDKYDRFDAQEDPDGDEMINVDEYNYIYGDLDPQDEDTDGDGHADGVEYEKNTNAKDPTDFPRSNLLAILLLLLAFIIVGGAIGYFAYVQYFEKTKPKKSLSTGAAKPLGAGLGKPKTGKPRSNKDLVKNLKGKLHNSKSSKLFNNIENTFGKFDSKDKPKVPPIKEKPEGVPAAKLRDKKVYPLKPEQLKEKSRTSGPALDELKKRTASKPVSKPKSSVELLKARQAAKGTDKVLPKIDKTKVVPDKKPVSNTKKVLDARSTPALKKIERRLETDKKKETSTKKKTTTKKSTTKKTPTTKKPTTKKAASTTKKKTTKKKVNKK